MSESDELEALARRAGVSPEYWDAFGAHAVVPAATKQAFLAGMGMAAGDAATAGHTLADLEAQTWRRPLPPCLVLRCEAEGLDRLPLVVAIPDTARDAALDWRLTPEGRDSADADSGHAALSGPGVTDAGTTTIDGTVYRRVALALPVALPWGYHTLDVALPGEAPARTVVIVAPWRSYLPDAMAQGGRVWGPSVQVYGLRGRDDWGMGDFADLRHLTALSARAGASVVGINPLHALFPTRPRHVSPYSPSSRLFLNPLYIHIPAVPELADSDGAAAIMETSGFRDRLGALAAGDLIDHEGVQALKRPLLEALFETFRTRHMGQGTARDVAFQAFRADRGRPLHLFAIHEALAETFADLGHSHREWPAEYHHPDAPAVARFAEDNAERVAFHEYLQFEADRQLAHVADTATQGGMTLGLYHDLALGADQTGADIWMNQDLVVDGVAVGAPPDPMNLKGQNWGFPPLNPVRLRERAYDIFIEVVRAGMRHAGALRIDHVLGLMRMFWIPAEAEAGDGGYVGYPFDEMLAVLALESHRQRCVVIGEDLGTVPDGFRERMAQENILSYRLFYFERRMDQSLKAPAEYPAKAAVAIGTHDLPTLRGFWTGHDLDVKNAIHLFPSDEVFDRERHARADDRDRILGTLAAAGCAVAGDDGSGSGLSADLADAIHRFMAATPSMILLLQIEDVLEELDQANVPGTVDEHPNWRRRLSVPVEDLATHPRFAALTALLRTARPRPS
ncbi:4-alpha-glucanotransferase [Roseospira marina]|uniref:4-alpha-glucanotransferase n=1 Tax=Roseospira marina TaxID=140057 RepID=A0A5M6ID95_9PROT|nr:4-alpha-glucanotransferase [Roseospira marina]KAA5606213.1 4-alpha-glucanotransferase [Roseospira marina]MBB4314361.1 4-alpha-glucanotransferase [Roseospira marina]MBB5087521.1 4-alpha-glucanotransferase [Roseospira marina]